VINHPLRRQRSSEFALVLLTRQRLSAYGGIPKVSSAGKATIGLTSSFIILSLVFALSNNGDNDRGTGFAPPAP